MRRLHRLAEAVARAGALAGGLLLLVAAIIIGVDIVLRYTVSRSIGGADELSGYALAIATAWGLSFALVHRAHIRIDSLYVVRRSLAMDAHVLLWTVGAIVSGLDVAVDRESGSLSIRRRTDHPHPVVGERAA